MSHADAIAGRLPDLYRDGELLRGVVGTAALQVEIFDEILREVQRARWFDTTVWRDEAARLGALLDIAAEPWQDLALYRAWVHALRDAMLASGAVTRGAIAGFVADFSARFGAATGGYPIGVIDPDPARWSRVPSSTGPAFVENPLRPVVFTPAPAGLPPLAQFSATVKGLDPVTPGMLFVGLEEGPECAPVLVNVTTGQALIFLGTVGPGQRLFIRPDGKGGLFARREGEDVSAQLRSVSGVVAGTPWPRTSVESPARAFSLPRGESHLWFLPVAHYDVAGLDRFLLALADLALTEGSFDRSAFDHALFSQAAAIRLTLVWRETQAARFEVQLPGGAALAPDGTGDMVVALRGELGAALDEAVARLRAASVSSTVELRPFTEVQPARDRLSAVLPMRLRERGPTGRDRLPDKGGTFEVTDYDDSTFR